VREARWESKCAVDNTSRGRGKKKERLSGKELWGLVRLRDKGRRLQNTKGGRPKKRPEREFLVRKKQLAWKGFNHFLTRGKKGKSGVGGDKGRFLRGSVSLKKKTED